MRFCPYCEGEVSETARKCKHCGEWLTPPPPPTPTSPPHHHPPSEPESGTTSSRRFLAPRDLFETSDHRHSLGNAANEWVKHHKSMSAIGMIVGGFIIVFIFIPMTCTMQKKMNEGPSFGGSSRSADEIIRDFEGR